MKYPYSWLNPANLFNEMFLFSIFPEASNSVNIHRLEEEEEEIEEERRKDSQVVLSEWGEGDWR